MSLKIRPLDNTIVTNGTTYTIHTMVSSQEPEPKDCCMYYEGCSEVLASKETVYFRGISVDGKRFSEDDFFDNIEHFPVELKKLISYREPLILVFCTRHFVLGTITD